MSRVIGLDDPSGKAALQGNIVHRVFEWMVKLNKRGKAIPEAWLIERAWDEFVATRPDLGLRKVTSRGEAADYRKCRNAVEIVLDDDYYNPCTMRNIIGAEIRFRIELPGEDWAVREGDEIRQFAIRGFIDLVREIDQDTVEIIDWKTGQRMDFYSRTPIGAQSLIRSIQPRIYHLAVTELFPQYRDVILTFHYMLDGGPITISLSQDDIPETLSMLWAFMKAVQGDNILRRNRSWKCKMCSYNREDFCTKVWSDLCARGQEYVEVEYGGDPPVDVVGE
jgi:hypothetical protein